MSKTLTSHWRLTLAAVLAASTVTPSALADLTSTYQFNGKGNWSIDALGNTVASDLGNVSALIPAGSTVEKALLYSAAYQFSSAFTPTVDFDGVTISGGDWTPLGVPLNACCGIQAFRTDVTSQVAGKVGGGGGMFDFPINREFPSTGDNGVDGEMLVVIYSNPAEVERTIGVVDGNAAVTGETTFINLSQPLTDPTAAGFEALMSLGIGFSYSGGDQGSQVDVNGRRLTSAAGGFDDGLLANGALITAGGLGDDPSNPANPFQGPSNNERYDDELYNLALGNVSDPTPFLATGQTQIRIDTRNTSQDDNIFFLGLNITAVAGINEPPPTQVIPETSTVVSGLAMVGLAGLAWRRRSRKA